MLLMTLAALFGARAALAQDVGFVWSAVEDPRALDYEIHYGRASGQYEASSPRTTETEQVISDLAAGETYYFAVRACLVGASTCSDFSAEVSAGIPYAAPDAAFAMNPTRGVAPLTIDFSDQSVGEITQREWTFADGATSSLAAPQHTFTDPGLHTITLAVSGPGGSDTATAVVEVTPAAPVVAFDVSGTAGVAPYTVSFADQSSGGGSAWSWDFGSAGHSSLPNPVWTFESAGVYSVTLTVTGPGGSATLTKQGLISVSAPPVIVTPERVIEVGEVLVDQDWQWVDFGRPFRDPIVIANPPSSNDRAPVVVRVSGVESDGFWIRMQAWDYLNDVHAFERVGYVVMEAGRHQVAVGQWVEAGRFVQGGRQLSSIGFTESFGRVPVVLTGIMSQNDAKAVTTRVSGVHLGGFQVRLDEQESLLSGHGAETIAYIAWQPSVGTLDGLSFVVAATGNQVGSKSFRLNFGSVWGEPPVFVAQMQTINETDTAVLRHQNLGTSSVEVRAEEETSKDRETNHKNESVGYALFSLAD
jgi:PKD repeat protein